jgi:hypothetical protein
VTLHWTAGRVLNTFRIGAEVIKDGYVVRPPWYNAREGGRFCHYVAVRNADELPDAIATVEASIARQLQEAGYDA